MNCLLGELNGSVNARIRIRVYKAMDGTHNNKYNSMFIFHFPVRREISGIYVI